MTPTDEQTHILSLARGTDNLMITALAGTGKTTTLEMVDKAVTTKPALYLVFNKANAKDAEKRMQSTTTVRTFNSLGHRIWAASCGKNLSLDPKKTAEILRSLINESPKSAQGEIWNSFWSVVQAVGTAKALGYVPEGAFTHARHLISRHDFHRALDEDPDDLTSSLIDEVLTRSIRAAYAGSIDYNDQIYMPALFGGIYPKFPLVLVDEAQDLSPVNHAMLSKLAKNRIIAVGDPYQSIYGFRGAMQSGMKKLQSTFSLAPADLSVSFRCPRAIVEAARWRVPHFKWINEGGHVEGLSRLQPASIPADAVVICRNNAPLISMAMGLLGAGRSVSVSGSDIGPKLIGIMKRLGDDSMSRTQLMSAIAEWEAEKLARESKSAPDLAACMRVFANNASTLSGAVSYAEHLFSAKGSIRLMTGHKSKGLEFDCVYHLDPFLLDDVEQDLNLRYVIQTRSKDRYYEINSTDIQW